MLSVSPHIFYQPQSVLPSKLIRRQAVSSIDTFSRHSTGIETIRFSRQPVNTQPIQEDILPFSPDQSGKITLPDELQQKGWSCELITQKNIQDRVHEIKAFCQGVDKQQYGLAGGDSKKQIYNLVNNHDAKSYLIRDSSGKIIAFGGLRVKGDKTGFLELLYVDPGNQKQGIGPLLLNTLIAFARLKGCSEVNLKTVHAQSFYERKAGFHAVGAEFWGRDSQGKDIIAVLMKKRLLTGKTQPTQRQNEGKPCFPLPWPTRQEKVLL